MMSSEVTPQKTLGGATSIDNSPVRDTAAAGTGAAVAPPEEATWLHNVDPGEAEKRWALYGTSTDDESDEAPILHQPTAHNSVEQAAAQPAFSMVSPSFTVIPINSLPQPQPNAAQVGAPAYAMIQTSNGPAFVALQYQPGTGGIPIIAGFQSVNLDSMTPSALHQHASPASGPAFQQQHQSPIMLSAQLAPPQQSAQGCEAKAPVAALRQQQPSNNISPKMNAAASTPVRMVTPKGMSVPVPVPITTLQAKAAIGVPPTVPTTPPAQQLPPMLRRKTASAQNLHTENAPTMVAGGQLGIPFPIPPGFMLMGGTMMGAPPPQLASQLAQSAAKQQSTTPPSNSAPSQMPRFVPVPVPVPVMALPSAITPHAMTADVAATHKATAAHRSSGGVAGPQTPPAKVVVSTGTRTAEAGSKKSTGEEDEAAQRKEQEMWASHLHLYHSHEVALGEVTSLMSSTQSARSNPPAKAKSRNTCDAATATLTPPVPTSNTPPLSEIGGLGRGELLVSMHSECVETTPTLDLMAGLNIAVGSIVVPEARTEPTVTMAEAASIDIEVRTPRDSDSSNKVPVEAERSNTATPPTLSPGPPTNSSTSTTASTWQPAYRARICKSFQATGTCKYGAKCVFVHPKP